MPVSGRGPPETAIADQTLLPIPGSLRNARIIRCEHSLLCRRPWTHRRHRSTGASDTSFRFPMAPPMEAPHAHHDKRGHERPPTPGCSGGRRGAFRQLRHVQRRGVSRAARPTVFDARWMRHRSRTRGVPGLWPVSFRTKARARTGVPSVLLPTRPFGL